MQKLSVIKLWVTGKVESSEVETNSLNHFKVLIARAGRPHLNLVKFYFTARPPATLFTVYTAVTI